MVRRMVVLGGVRRGVSSGIVVLLVAAGLVVIPSTPVAAGDECGITVRIRFEPSDPVEPFAELYRSDEGPFRRRDRIARISVEQLESPAGETVESCGQQHKHRKMIDKREISEAAVITCELGDSWSASVSWKGPNNHPKFANANLLNLDNSRRRAAYVVIKAGGSFAKYDAQVCEATEPS